jgi:hypothetical protein
MHQARHADAEVVGRFDDDRFASGSPAAASSASNTVVNAEPSAMRFHRRRSPLGSASSVRFSTAVAEQ